mgnify:CR=1 FL=1
MARGSLRTILGLSRPDERKAPHEEFLRDLIYTIETQEPGDPPSKTYKPSSLACIRNMYYQRIGVETEPGGMDYQGQGMCESGSDRHVRLQGWICKMKERGIDCEYYDVESYLNLMGITDVVVREKQGMETKCFHTGLNMSFMTDGIIRYKGVWYVLEIKTEISGKWYRREDIEENHKTQATCYCLAFHIDKSIFLYENRDMLCLKSYLIHVGKDRTDAVVSKITECEGYVQRGITPPRPEDVNCRYCAYSGRCRADGK